MKDNPKLKGKKGLFIAEKPDAMKEFNDSFVFIKMSLVSSWTLTQRLVW